MAVPAAPTNISITTLSVNSFSVTWTTVPNIITTSFYFNGSIVAIIPATLGTPVGLTVAYKVVISGINKDQANFPLNVVLGNNSLHLIVNNINGPSVISFPRTFYYDTKLNPIYIDYNIISSYTIIDLISQVKNLMSIGWEVIGSIVPFNNQCYIQTMVTTEKFHIKHILI